MKDPKQMSHTATLVEGALMIAVAFVLSFLTVSPLPFGGSISLVSTLPLILMSYRHGAGWGVGTASIYGLLQMFQGFQNVLAVPASNVYAMIGCALLDYILAYAVIGLSGPIGRRFSNHTASIIAGVGITGILRYLSSVLSGVLIWSQYVWGGWSLWPYSFVYNATWCVPDVLLTLIVMLILSKIPAFSIFPKAKEIKTN